MKNGTSNDFFDIDELVNSLIQDHEFTDGDLPDMELAGELADRIVNPDAVTTYEPLLLDTEPVIPVDEECESEPAVLLEDIPQTIVE